jgi:hypothetical protein
MRTLMWCLAAVIIGAPASRVLGQSGNDAIGYIALVSTPTAGVPPVVKQWMLADPAHGVGVESQWGHVSGNGGSVDTFLSGVTLPLAEGRADVGFSAGYLKPTCDLGDCAGYAVASGVVEGRVLQSQAGSATFVLGLSGRIGFAKPSDATTWSASASAPLSLAMGSATGVQFVPFVSPGFGWGHISEGSDSESGTRFMLGGGVGIVSMNSGLGFTLGAQKVFIDGGKLVFGAGVTWARR